MADTFGLRKYEDLARPTQLSTLDLWRLATDVGPDDYVVDANIDDGVYTQVCIDLRAKIIAFDAIGQHQYLKYQVEELGGEFVSAVAGGPLSSVAADGTLHLSIDDVVGDRVVSAIRIAPEHSEISILAGALGTIRSHLPVIFINAPDKRSLIAQEALLEPLGYFEAIVEDGTCVWQVL
ncbi:MAG: hypothetical protein ROR55_19920 [Devosia sp.]